MLKTQLTEGGRQFPSRRCQNVPSYWYHHPIRSLRRAIAYLAVLDTIENILKKLAHMFLFMLTKAHQLQQQYHAKPATFSQCLMESMSLDSSFYVRLCFVKNVSPTYQDLITFRTLIFEAHKIQGRFYNLNTQQK